MGSIFKKLPITRFHVAESLPATSQQIKPGAHRPSKNPEAT